MLNVNKCNFLSQTKMLFSKGSNKSSRPTPSSHQTLANQRMKQLNGTILKAHSLRPLCQTLFSTSVKISIHAAHQPGSAEPLFVAPRSQYLILQTDMHMKDYGCLSCSKYSLPLSFWVQKSNRTGS